MLLLQLRAIQTRMAATDVGPPSTAGSGKGASNARKQRERQQALRDMTPDCFPFVWPPSEHADATKRRKHVPPSDDFFLHTTLSSAASVAKDRLLGNLRACSRTCSICCMPAGGR